MIFLAGLFKGAWKYLAVAAVAIGGVLAFGASERRKGAQREKGKQAEKVNEKAVKAKRARRGATRKRMSRFDRD